MNSIPDCKTDQVASIDHATRAGRPALITASHEYRHAYHRRMQTSYLRPFRKALRRLLTWVRREHITVQTGRPGEPPVGLHLRKVGWETIAVSILFGPLVFLFLLPLIIILLPVVIFIGLAAIAVSSIQTDKDDKEHHTLPWHTMH